MMRRSNRLMFLIALFISGGIAGCGTRETQCFLDKKIECFYVISDLWYYSILAWVIIPYTIASLVSIYIIYKYVKFSKYNEDNNIKLGPVQNILMYLLFCSPILLVFWLALSINLQVSKSIYNQGLNSINDQNKGKSYRVRGLRRRSHINDKKWQNKRNLYLIFESKEKASSSIIDLKEYRQSKLLPIHEKNVAEYKRHYNDIRQRLPRLGLYSHQDLLRNRERYREEINLLERTAILRHSLNWLEPKIAKVDAQISDLNQNVWKMEKKLELSTVASPEEQAQVDKIIAITKEILEENITPPEAQDLGKLEQTIFDEIMRRR